MRLIVHTKVLENRGGPDTPDWIEKPGGEYLITDLDLGELSRLGAAGIRNMVHKATNDCPNCLCYASDVYQEQYAGWEVTAGRTRQEDTQILNGGRVRFPVQDLYATESWMHSAPVRNPFEHPLA